MDPQLQKAFADIVAALQASAQQIGAAAQEQLPLLVQEYLKWGAFEASRWMTFELCGVVIVFGFLTILWGYTFLSRNRLDDGSFDALIGVSLLGWVLIVVLAIFGYLNYMTMKQIEMAPRVYLIEKIKGIVK